ncbi:hypothetical protein TOPH_05892 [Tolypocladium ophioglossoides CBS 100239]|uniref:Uncharacterized protein n=1 Tax=Tolypocladium ophioglossoides (strain CBS 100239) TaxID=1163406 RepID=A0A0L0N632_TOLOC|nr:hypothetical protein TOPH_05892 [Tolypocladium ophioglossoides CBS 100239]
MQPLELQTCAVDPRRPLLLWCDLKSDQAQIDQPTGGQTSKPRPRPSSGSLYLASDQGRHQCCALSLQHHRQPSNNSNTKGASRGLAAAITTRAPYSYPVLPSDCTTSANERPFGPVGLVLNPRHPRERPLPQAIRPPVRPSLGDAPAASLRASDVTLRRDDRLVNPRGRLIVTSSPRLRHEPSLALRAAPQSLSHPDSAVRERERKTIPPAVPPTSSASLNPNRDRKRNVVARRALPVPTSRSSSDCVRLRPLCFLLAACLVVFLAVPGI